MSVIIRLRGLPVTADSVDIRHFFIGLDIPRGGVYIIGGLYGEAFIAFANVEDARCALNLSGRMLKNSPIHLSLSSETEMRYAFEINRISTSQSLQPLSYPNFGNGAERNGIHTLTQPLRGEQSVFSNSPSFLYLRGMPLKATKVEIKEFFRGLVVEEAIFLKFPNGVRNGSAIVKFGRSTDANEGLAFSRLFMGTSRISIVLADEFQWIRAGGTRKEPSPQRSSNSGRKRSPSRSPVRKHMKRVAVYTNEFYVHLVNLSYSASKRDIRKHFYFADLDDGQIKFLLDKSGKKTREGFVMFKSGKDYKRALDLHKDIFMGRSLSIFSIPKRAMKDLIAKEGKVTSSSRERSAQKDLPKKSSQEPQSDQANCLYLRNFSFDVTKSDVQNFLSGISLNEKDIFLLRDDKGVGLGEALVKFSTEKEASSAEKHNRKKYLGTEILLRRITEKQMKAFGVDIEVNSLEESVPLVTETDDTPEATEWACTIDAVQIAPASDPPEVALESDPPEITPPSDAQEVALASDPPEITFVPNTQEVALASDLPNTQEVALASDLPNTQEVALASDLPNTQEVALASDLPNTQEVALASDLPNTQEVALASDVLEIKSTSFPLTMESDPQEVISVLDKNKIVPVQDSTEMAPPFGPAEISTDLHSTELKNVSESAEVNPIIDLTDNSEHDSAPKEVIESDLDISLNEDANLNSNHDRKQNGIIVYIRNLPCTVTVAEILDFFYGYKVSCVDLKQTDSGTATVQMQNYEEAVSVVNELNNRSVGQKQVTLSLV
ncbi:RNA-binding protein 12B-like [Pelodytes ibericus]